MNILNFQQKIYMNLQMIYKKNDVKLYQIAKKNYLSKKNENINNPQHENKNNDFGGFKKGFLLADCKNKFSSFNSQEETKVDDNQIANKINLINLEPQSSKIDNKPIKSQKM